jgi:hypothetical protein
MSVQTAMVAVKSANATLQALVGTRFHPDEAEQNTALPNVVFQEIVTTWTYAFGGISQMTHCHIQIDGYATTSANRTILSEAIMGAFDRTQGTFGGETVQDIKLLARRKTKEMTNTNTAAYRVTFDFMVDFSGRVE